MSDIDEKMIKCLFIPVANGEQLLLPNAAIAEIVPVDQIMPLADSPDWVLGMLDWRGCSVPLISYEVCGGGELPELSSNVQIAVMYGLESAKRPYIALLMQGIPRVARFAKEDIEESDIVNRPELISQIVNVGLDRAGILNLHLLEEKLQQANF